MDCQLSHTINDRESLKGASTSNCFRYQDWNTSAIDFVDGQTQGKEVKKQKTIAVVSCLGKGFQASETTCEDDHEWGNVTEHVKTWLKEKRKSVVVDIQRTVEIEQFINSANTSNVCQPDITQKPSSVNSSDDSTDSDPESTSSSSTDSNLLKKSLKRKHRASNKKAGKKKKKRKGAEK